MQQGLGIPGGSNGEESACNTETRVRSVGWEDSPEESLGLQRMGHNWTADTEQQEGLKGETLDQESSDKITDLNLLG